MPDNLRPGCDSYAGRRLHALEVEQVGLAVLGIGPGARLTFSDGPCPSP